jgi:hypothetical protein
MKSSDTELFELAKSLSPCSWFWSVWLLQNRQRQLELRPNLNYVLEGLKVGSEVLQEILISAHPMTLLPGTYPKDL